MLNTGHVLTTKNVYKYDPGTFLFTYASQHIHFCSSGGVFFAFVTDCVDNARRYIAYKECFQAYHRIRSSDNHIPHFTCAYIQMLYIQYWFSSSSGTPNYQHTLRLYFRQGYLITCQVKCGAQSCIHFQTSMVALLKLGNGWQISSCNLEWRWLLIHVVS